MNYSPGSVIDTETLNNLEDYSTKKDLSDITTHESAGTSGLVTLVNLTGPGKLLGGHVAGYYPVSVLGGYNYRVTITIDGNSFDYPINNAYSQGPTGQNTAAISIPPFEFNSDLKIQYNRAGGYRVYGIAWTKQ